MSKPVPDGAQAPDQPYPGTIAHRLRWNDSTESPKAADFFDSAGNRVDRGRATYCVPVVEIDTVSFDENGKGVAPKDADATESAIDGPSHGRDESMAGRGDTPGDPHRPPSVPTFFATGNPEAATGARGQRVTFWRRVKRWLLSRPGVARPLNPSPLSPHDD